MNKTHYSILIIGGGTAGIDVAARLRAKAPKLDIAIIDPSEKHYYQPLWTLVGGGVTNKEVTEKNEADLIPRGVTWIRDAVVAFEPAENRVRLRSDRPLGYKIFSLTKYTTTVIVTRKKTTVVYRSV